jgi:hypothetical protein
MLQVVQGDTAILQEDLKFGDWNQCPEGLINHLPERILQNVEGVKGTGAQHQQRQKHDGQGDNQTGAERIREGDRPSHQADLLGRRAHTMTWPKMYKL